MDSLNKHPESDPRYVAHKNAFRDSLRQKSVAELEAMDSERARIQEHVLDRVFGGSKSQRWEAAEAASEQRMIREELGLRRHT